MVNNKYTGDIIMPDYQEKILQNLKDANCDNDLISRFFQFEQTGKIQEQLRLLLTHRKNLLDSLHKNQKQIDCLDYLIFTLEQKGILWK